VQLYDEKNDNSALMSYFQQNDEPDIRNNVLINLVSQFIKRPVYDTLRTEEQLGYVV
jgi:secreted Zn-dependent insulinase-like peptidase